MYIFLAFGLLFTSSCVTFRNIENTRPRLDKPESNDVFDLRQIEKLDQEDIILVTTYQAQRYYLIYQETDEQHLKGMLMREPVTNDPIAVKDRYQMRIPVTEIKKVQIRKYNYISGLALPAAIVISLYAMLAISLRNSEYNM
ncbi:hypothetical protein [Mariniradius sediminis]|uniref:Uncharacterized protein n=1 Tax=Mariniradius sediminis TaxID=2909237 RepID=A0ABS9BY47_9BACT|nr:hypothetical protein [Mariniradius sediminis]MCF1752981.1 hypothetical protein [Mariniradius sediminis]